MPTQYLDIPTLYFITEPVAFTTDPNLRVSNGAFRHSVNLWSIWSFLMHGYRIGELDHFRIK